MLPSFIMPSKLYDTLKWLVLVVLPSVGAAYFSLGELYNWSNALQVVGTISIITTFLGAIVGISNVNFKATHDFVGEIVLEEDPDTPGKFVYALELDGAPEEIADMNSISFRVVKP